MLMVIKSKGSVSSFEGQEIEFFLIKKIFINYGM